MIKVSLRKIPLSENEIHNCPGCHCEMYLKEYSIKGSKIYTLIGRHKPDCLIGMSVLPSYLSKEEAVRSWNKASS